MTKKRKWIYGSLALLLAVLVVLGIPALRGAKYNRAVQNWEQGQYMKAFTAFYSLGNYRDAEAYRQAVEEMLVQSLMTTPWRSPEAKLQMEGYEATGVWQFLFREDFTGTENHIATDLNGSETVKTDEFTYAFQCSAGRMMLVITYEAGEEAPYLLTLSQENGALTVEKLYGALQFYETYDMVDYFREQ